MSDRLAESIEALAMSNHVLLLLFGSAIGMTFLSSCQPLPDPNENRFTTNRTPVEVAPSVRADDAELFASNPLVEFQTTGANPAPIRALSAGQTLTILGTDGRFTQVRLMDGTVGYINSNDIQQGTSGYTGGSGGHRVADQYGNRFGGGPRPDDVNPPTTEPPVQPTTPTNPTTPEPDMIDLDNF